MVMFLIVVWCWYVDVGGGKEEGWGGLFVLGDSFNFFFFVFGKFERIMSNFMYRFFIKFINL